MRTILFHRKYRRFHGGHLKVWHYFNHTIAAPGFDARVLFDVDSSWDSTNPWTVARDRVVESPIGLTPDILFIAGRDWQRLEGLGFLDRGVPVLNFIQHVRHADDWSIQSRYLGRKAIRICVSEEVADAVRAAGAAGPTVVIPNAVDVPVLGASNQGQREVDLLIAGLKQPSLALEAAKRLSGSEKTIEVLTEHVPREHFLGAIRRARVTLFLPNEEEGFYLPALEGMALGTIVVCPDCVGNRSFCLPGFNAFRPDYRLVEIVVATEAALRLSKAVADEMRQHGLETALQHSPAGERAAYLELLRNLDDLWAAA